MFAQRESRGTVEIAFTDRHGPDGSPLDLADAAAPAVAAAALAPRASYATMVQVHGADVAMVDAGPDAPPPTADALVTTAPDCVLVVRVADCVPVLLADPEAGVIGAAHAGRAGLLAGVVPATWHAMADLGARRVHAWVGPAICGGCYEVPAAMQEDVCRVVPQARARTTWDTPSIDLVAGVVAQVRDLGAEPAVLSRCTRESDDLWSYRRDGAGAGRLGGLIVRRAS